MWHPTTDEVHREAHDFLSRSGPQQQRGYYYTAQELNELRMEQAVQNELELDRLRKEAEEEEERQQQLAANGGVLPTVTETPEMADQSQQRVVHLSGPAMVIRPTESETFHIRQHEQPPLQPQPLPQYQSTSPAQPSNNATSPSKPQPAAISASTKRPPSLRRQDTSMAEVDLSKVKDERLREVFDPNSSTGMHELAGWSDEELDNLVDNFQPEYLPGLIKKGIKTEGGHSASSLCWEGLTYTNKKDEKLLRHVSGYLHPGQMVGILAGPDGGATPLLNVLAGREKDSAWTGSVLYNGQQRTEEFKRVTGFVDKNDTHIALLTVYETLYFSARLRLPQALPDNLVRLRVKIVMKLLGLSHVAETYIGDAAVRGVSGGEKRRVSFGVEMVAGRECLLADLPTNGLDSSSAYALMRTMRFTCKGGLSMMASVVQPSTEMFQLFHNVLVLSKGAVLYFGPPSKAENHFADAGFRRPASKSLPQFLEELSAAPERFYIHRFNRELQHRGEGDQDINKHDDTNDKPLGEMGQGLNKDDGQERKEDAGEWRGEDRASRSQALQPLSPQHGQQQQQQQRGSEVEMQRQGSAASQQRTQRQGSEGQVGNADEADKIPRSPDGVDNARVQCWNVLVDHYESSKFKGRVAQQIEEDKAGSEQGDNNTNTNNMQQPQQQSQQQLQSYGSQGKQLDGAAAGAAAYNRNGQQGGRVSYQPRQQAGGNSGKDGHDGGGFYERKSHGIFNFWYARYNSSLSTQMAQNLKRMSLVFLRNVGLWRNTWLRAIFIGFILGSLFYNLHATQTDIRNRVGLIFFIALYVGFGGVQLFPILSSQRPVYYKQLQAGYFQGITYYISLQLVQLPILVLETTFLLVPVWGLSNLSGGDFSSNQFWFAWITLFITSLIGRAWVMVLLAISPIEAMANVLLVMTNILFVTLCGFLIPKDKIEAGWHWFWYISYISYTFRSLAINDIEPLYNNCELGAPGCPYNSGQDALESLFGIDGTYNKWKDFGRLCGIFIAFSVGAAIAYNVVSWDKPDTPEAPDWGDVGAEGAEQQEALMVADGKPVPPKPRDNMKGSKESKKSKIVRSMDNLTVSAQMANAEPGDAPAANSQGNGSGEGQARPERPNQGATSDEQDDNTSEGTKGADGKILATKPMRPRDDSIPMPIPAAALQVVKAKKSNSSPALLQKEELQAKENKRKEEEQKQRGDSGQQQQSNRPSAPPLHRAVSHDFGFEIEGKQTEALVSGVKSYMQWRDLSYTVTLDNGKQRQLLNKTFGYVRPGIMCALMGASGAGKSTLLDVLAGKKTSGHIEGEMLVNGRPKDETFTRIAGYVEQNDAHNPMSTVREAIAFSGRMRLPQHVSNAELQMKVRNVLEVLGLAHLADDTIGSPGMGGVSPEVRKKVTIGVELIAEPSILFLDEPTTGLDSAGAYAVMSAVHTLSKHMAVVCTVHQPSMELTKMFDDILIMKDGGEVVYFGAMSGLVTFFAESGLGECPPGKNPVDFALDQLRRANEMNKKGPKLREEDKQKQDEEREKQNGGLIKRLSRQFSRKSANPEPERQGHDHSPTAGANDGSDHKERREDHDVDVEAQNAKTRQKRQDDMAARGEALQSSGDTEQNGEGEKGEKKRSKGNEISPEAANKLSSLFTESNFYEGIKKTLDQGVMPEDEKKAYRPPDMKSTHANTLTQITWLTHRFFTNVLRNKFGMVIRFFLILMFMFFVGTIFLRLGYNQSWAQQRLGVMFLVLINVMFSTNAFLPEIYFNRPIYFREYTANMYSSFSYFVARYLGDAPYVVFECILYSLLYFWVDMNPYHNNRGYGYWIWLLCILRWTGIALTHLFGTAIAAPDFAATLLITFYQVMLAFTGFLIPGPSIPSWWIWLYDISFIRYALDTAVYFNFIHETFECDGNYVPVYAPYTAGCPIPPDQNAAAAGRPMSFGGQPVTYKCQISCAYDIFEQNGIEWSDGIIVRQFAILHCFAIFFFVCAFLALRFINHVKR